LLLKAEEFLSRNSPDAGKFKFSAVYGSLCCTFSEFKSSRPRTIASFYDEVVEREDEIKLMQSIENRSIERKCIANRQKRKSERERETESKKEN